MRSSWSMGPLGLLGLILIALPAARATTPVQVRGRELAPPPRAVEPQRQVAPQPRPATRRLLPKIADQVEVVVLAPERPVRIRLRVEYMGKSLTEAWMTTLRKAFEFFDRNKDGVLSPAEAQNIYSDSGLALLLQNGTYQPTPKDIPSIAVLDRNGDGVVSFEEFVVYYKKSSAYALRSLPMAPEDPSPGNVTRSLFSLLDTNRDGKLSREELRAAENLLTELDTDEDECLSLNEILAYSRNQQMQNGSRNTEQTVAKAKVAQAAMSYPFQQIPESLTDQIIKTYDKNGDKKLSREESGFDAATFARLDKNGDGELSRDELDAWRTGPPELEVLLSYASKQADAIARLLTDGKLIQQLGLACNQIDPARLVVRAGRHPIEIEVNATYSFEQAGTAARTKNQFAGLFTLAAGAKGYITEKDLGGANAVQLQFLRVLFDAADADGDGKLTRAEFDAYFDLQDEFRSVSLGVRPLIQTPTLFQLLDEDRDGRLSRRELRTAWDRLIQLEPPGSQALTREGIKPTVHIRLQQSYLQAMDYDLRVAVTMSQDNRKPEKGPLWFRRMDRNADGDVSRSEFLGTREEFDAIDTDHDGLISVQEAEAFDRKMVKPLVKAPLPRARVKLVEKKPR